MTLTERTGIIERMKKRIKVLRETAWDAGLNEPIINRWLDNFSSCGRNVENDKLHALHLLSNFMYFGRYELRALLRRLYRDLFRYPIIQQIRKHSQDVADFSAISDRYEVELEHSRFLGIGSPAESGAHLLYYLRQETDLPKNLFIDSSALFYNTQASNTVKNNGVIPRGAQRLRDEKVRHYIFIDDLCASGQQASEYTGKLLKKIRTLGGNAKLHYYVLLATEQGLEVVRNSTMFDQCECVLELDRSYRVFESNRYFEPPTDGIERAYSKDMCYHYGCQLWPTGPLGYCSCQLLLGFQHNTPDNTLPIIWADSTIGTGRRWEPIFRRYGKM